MLNLKVCAERAFEIVQPSIDAFLAVTEGRNTLHMVILDPTVPWSKGADLPILAERTFGQNDRRLWSHPFDEIARSKADICWRTGMSSRVVGENAAYLYLTGDVKYPGGVVCDGLICAGSGLDWEYDEAFAHTVIAFLWAQARTFRETVMAEKSRLIF